MKKAQLTITDPEDQITSKLHLLKKEHQINISSFCRNYVDQGIERYLKKVSCQKTTNTPFQSNETNNPSDEYDYRNCKKEEQETR